LDEEFYSCVFIQKKMAVSRQPIFVNLKSNTMKNMMQIYKVYVIQHYILRVFP